MPLFLPSIDTRYRQTVLSPSPDGLNRTFTTGEEFIEESISIYHNGRKLKLAYDKTVNTGDYYVSESGGVSTGFDTIVIISFSPSAHSVLTTTYFIP